MPIVVVGLNHRSAPIALRERFAVREDAIGAAFTTLRERFGISEVIILSTCNRVELYASMPDPREATRPLEQFLSEHAGVTRSVLDEHLYTMVEPRSIRHLFAVASGLDSMVLGECEILHQVKRAYEMAQAHGAAGKAMNLLFQRALNAAKSVRSQTAISRGCTSVASVAVELSLKIFDNLQQATVLLIGAGKIGELTLKRLRMRGVRDLRIMNRSLARAHELAARADAVGLALEHLPAQLLEADIVITSTSAPSAILHQAEVAAAMHGRHQRSLCIVDLGVPRNVAASVGQLDNVYLFDIDDLQGLVDHHSQDREQAVREAQVILDHKVSHFVTRWQEEGACVPSSSAPVAVH